MGEGWGISIFEQPIGVQCVPDRSIDVQDRSIDVQDRSIDVQGRSINDVSTITHDMFLSWRTLT